MLQVCVIKNSLHGIWAEEINVTHRKWSRVLTVVVLGPCL